MRCTLFLNSLSKIGSMASGVASGFGRRFLDNLGSREIQIPCKAIDVVLRNNLTKEGIDLKAFCCGTDGFALKLQATKMCAEVEMDLLLQVTRLCLRGNCAELIMRVVRSEMHGTNLLGKVVSCVVHAILKDVLSGVIRLASLQSRLDYDKATKEARVDLKGISAVDHLYSENLITNDKRIIDLVQITSVRHTDKGLALSYQLSDDLGGQVLQTVRTILSKSDGE